MRDYISRTLESVSAQCYPDIEHIIVDGGSDDGTIGVIEAFAANNKGIQWISEPDHGIGHAMNKGVELASGEIFGCLHADDYYSDETIVRQVAEAFENPGVIWVTGGICEVDSRGCEKRVLPVRRFSKRRLLRNNILFHPATFVRRDVFRDLGGFDEQLRYVMDYDLWLRFATISPPITINSELARFRVHSGSISSSHRVEALEEEYAVRRRYLNGSFGLFPHALYQKYRLFVEE